MNKVPPSSTRPTARTGWYGCRWRMPRWRSRSSCANSICCTAMPCRRANALPSSRPCAARSARCRPMRRRVSRAGPCPSRRPSRPPWSTRWMSGRCWRWATCAVSLPCVIPKATVATECQHCWPSARSRYSPTGRWICVAASSCRMPPTGASCTRSFPPRKLSVSPKLP